MENLFKKRPVSKLKFFSVFFNEGWNIGTILPKKDQKHYEPEAFIANCKLLWCPIAWADIMIQCDNRTRRVHDHTGLALRGIAVLWKKKRFQTIFFGHGKWRSANLWRGNFTKLQKMYSIEKSDSDHQRENWAQGFLLRLAKLWIFMPEKIRSIKFLRNSGVTYYGLITLARLLFY